MKLVFFSTAFRKKFLNMKFNEYSSIERRLVPSGHMDAWTDGRTDMTKLIVAFRNFAKAPTNCHFKIN